VTVDSISIRALNRATLARQMLLERSDSSALAAIDHLGGLQAQAPNPPYFGLWSRLADFRTSDLADLIERRDVVRIAAMRSTVHLLSATDALEFRALLQPSLERGLRASPFGKELAAAGVDIAEMAQAGRVLMDEAPRTGSELATLLASRWPSLRPLAIQNALRTHLALVQVPPRGLWGRSGQPTLTTVEAWLGRPLAPQPSLDRMVLRHIAAFGPSSTADVQAWCGLTRLGEVIDRLAPKLIEFRCPSGAIVWDLPEAPRPEEDTPAPVRLIAEFDNITLSYADRTRVLSDDDRRRAYTANGIVPGMILVDGSMAGTWKLRQTKTHAELQIIAFRKLPTRVRTEVTAEAASMLAFAAPDAVPAITWADE
jgi:hypothetical protein